MSKIKRKYMSLVEVLFAIGVLAIFFNMATMFYYNGRKDSMKYMDKAAFVREASLISKNWRDFVHSNSAPLEIESGIVKFSNSIQALVENNKIIFKTKENKKTFTLPKSFTASFAIEKDPHKYHLLVLYLKRKGSKGQVLKDKFLRIVASNGDKK